MMGGIKSVSCALSVVMLTALVAANGETLSPSPPSALGYQRPSPLPAPLPSDGAKSRSPMQAGSADPTLLPQPSRVDDKRIQQMMPNQGPNQPAQRLPGQN